MTCTQRYIERLFTSIKHVTFINLKIILKMQIPNSDKPDMNPSAIDNKRFRIQKVENP